MRLEIAGATDVGLVRKMNQDRYFFDTAHGLSVLADGVGGRKGGEVAAQIAVDGIRDAFLAAQKIPSPSDFLREAIRKVQAQVVARGSADERFSGMGSTLLITSFIAGQVYVANVGDSRAYLFYHDHLWQLTIDHNVETFLSRGWIKRETLGPKVKGAALVRSVGMGEDCEPDIYQCESRPDMLFLSCSDGLYGMVDDKEISRLIKKYRQDLSALARRLIVAAHQGGGKDNVTLTLAMVR